MGGLVIKRAYILAKQKEEFLALGQRVRAIIFLATPHRGSDLAQLLSKILSVASGARPFVSDLHRNSLATQSINDEFPQHCQNLQLYSFYETLPTNYGLGKSLVVDKDLATLGYANERTAYLNANHREICKYDTPSDPNYQTVRNALAATIDHFRRRAVSSTREINNAHQRLLDEALGVSEAPENDFMVAEALRMRGSCEWLVNKGSFQTWRDSANTAIYWISAKPATGKTILSGKVIHHLKDLNRDIVFYFFDYRSKAKITIISFLLSIAWQMSHEHPEVRECLLGICEKDNRLCKSDYRTVWRKVFVEGILRIKFVRPQYWVIDALDECKTGSDLVPLLLKAIETSTIRILLTSRDRFESPRQLINSRQMVFSDQISEEQTKSDIVLYLEANMDQLPSIDEAAQQNMVATIIQKSSGCFLWVSLILQELRRIHTSAEIRQVLDNVPSDMNELYSRILESMSQAPYGKLLAKAILTWTVCSTRPLTTDELYHALQFDMEDSIDSVERSIVSSCGQLVYIDAQSRVQIVHQTARDFLLKAASTSEFGIDAKAGHKRLAMTCLRYLSGSEMKGPKYRKSSASNVMKQRCPFVTYACNSFFQHVYHVSSTDDDILLALIKFLQSSNVLSWIEYLALNSNLNYLIQAGKAFKNFLQRRSIRLSPIGKEIALLDSWSNDLVRLVTKFGKILLASPPSIFHLIPPFCPPESAPHKLFAVSNRGIAVLGLSTTTWDDCLSTIVNTSLQFSAVACSERYFALGTSSGSIIVYNDMTCQETRTLHHGELVRLLKFGRRTDVLVSAGPKTIRVWDSSSWGAIWQSEMSQQCMAIEVMEEEDLLLGALKNNRLLIWDLSTGNLRDSSDWTEDLEGPVSHAYRRPMAASFCKEWNLLAVLYRGQDILVWDLERNALHETYCKETGIRAYNHQRRSADPGAIGLIFSTAPNMALLAASYSDGDLVLFDTSEGIVRETTVANAQSLACSPDGRTLACGNSSGTVQLFDFETLRLLYRINSGDYIIKALAFSEDSHRLLDIRGSECRLWDPTVLVRQDTDEETSDTISVSTAPQEVSLDASEDPLLITSITCPGVEGIFFVGKENGTVYLYETKSGRQSLKLFSHADGVSVLALAFDLEANILISTDSSSRVLAYQLNHQQQSWESGEVVFDYRAGLAVEQVMSNRGATRLLVSTAGTDSLWSLSADGGKIIEEVIWPNRCTHRWITHPSQQDQLILISENKAYLYEWETLRKLSGEILLEGSILPELTIQSIIPCFDGTIIATTFVENSRPRSESKLLLWQSSDFAIDSRSAIPVPKYRFFADQVRAIIGSDGHRLVFLHSSNWVCSADFQTTSNDEYFRHFFLPADWLSTDAGLIIDLTHDGDVIFVKRDEVAVIRRGLNNVEQAASNIPGKRPSLLAGRRPSLKMPYDTH